MTETMRLAKRMAQDGGVSRREAERLIERGRVHVNGLLVTTCATVVEPDDRIFIDGTLLNDNSEARIWLFHKPPGVLVTRWDEEGRPTVFDLLPPNFPYVRAVGRLDFTSEGLLLLTTSGALAHAFETGTCVRVYQIKAHGVRSRSFLRDLALGVTVEDVQYAPIQARMLEREGGACWIEMRLTEGKNREIRRIAEHFDWKIERLVRMRFGSFSLGDLPLGAWAEARI